MLTQYDIIRRLGASIPFDFSNLNPDGEGILTAAGSWIFVFTVRQVGGSADVTTKRSPTASGITLQVVDGVLHATLTLKTDGTDGTYTASRTWVTPESSEKTGTDYLWHLWADDGTGLKYPIQSGSLSLISSNPEEYATS